jgi:hypothetical protein
MKKVLSILLPVLFLLGTAASAGIAPAISIPAVLLLGSLGNTVTGVHTAGAIDFTNLAASLGAYSRQNSDTIMSELMLGMDIEDRVTVLDEVDDEIPLIKMITGDLIKPGGDPTSFSAAGDEFTPDPRMIKVRPWKVDLTFYPQLLERQYNTFLRGQKITPNELPFAEFFFNEVSKKANENARASVLFKGVHNASGTTPTDVADGYLKIIADEITATNITPVATGVVSLATILDDVDDTIAGLHEAAQSAGGDVLVSPTLFKWYVHKYRTEYGGNANYTGMAKDMVEIDGTNFILKREPGLAGSQRIIATVSQNLYLGVGHEGSDGNIIIQPNKRGIDVMVDAKIGPQIYSIGNRALAVNDQA